MKTRRIPGNKFTKEAKDLKEAAKNEFLPSEKWSLVLAGDLSDWDHRFQALKRLDDRIKENPDLFDGQIPRTYVDLANKFIRLTELIHDSFVF